MPKPSTSIPAPRVRHGMANTSARAWWAGSSSPGTPPVNVTWSATPQSWASLRNVSQIRAAPDDHQRGPVDPAPDRRQRPDQHVLAFARHQPRQAHHGGPLPQPVTLTQLRPGGRIWPEPVGVHPGRQVFQRRRRTEGRREPGPGIAADVGDDVGLVADPAQYRTRAGKHGPAHFVAVGAGQHPGRPGLPGPLRQQGQWRGRAEPHGVDAVLGDQSAHPAVDAGTGQHQCGGMPHHPIAGDVGGLVEGVGALPPRRVNGHGV